MNRFVTILLLLGALQSQAAVWVNSLLDLSTQTTGATATGTVLNNGMTGAQSSGWGISGTGSALTVQAHGIDDSTLFIINGTNSPTNQRFKTLQLANTSANTYAEFTSFPSTHKIQITGWIKPAMSLAASGTHYYDMVVVHNASGHGAYFQAQVTSSSRKVNLEGTFSGTTHSSEYTISPVWHWFVMRVDYDSSLEEIWLFTTNGTQVANLSNSNLGTASDVHDLRIGNAEAGSDGGTTTFQGVSWDYTYMDTVPQPNLGLLYPPERLADWWNAGTNPPTVTSVSTTLSPSGGDDTSAINSALSSASSNQVVMLGAGTYTLSGIVDSFHDGVVLRGTMSNGTNASILNWSSTRAIRMWNNHFSEGLLANDSSITANIRKGDTTIKVSSIPSWVRVGTIIGLDQLNDGVVSTENTDREGTGTYRARAAAGSNGERGQGELVLVATASGTTITTVHPILHDFLTSRTAQIFEAAMDSSSYYPLRKAGLENLTIVGSGSSSSDARAFSMIQCLNCWITNCISVNSRSKHLFVEFCYGSEVTGNLFAETMNHAVAEGYGIQVTDLSTRNRFQNNIIAQTGIGIQTSDGSCGNVVGYNYLHALLSTSGDVPDLSVHGNSGDYNLFEGNYAEGKARFDCVHGSSYANMLYRNTCLGTNDIDSDTGLASDNQIGVDVDYWNHDYTILGNVLGVASFHATRDKIAPASCSSSSDKVVYKWGYVNPFGCDASSYDTQVLLNTLTHNNWDAVTSTNSGVVYDSTLVGSTTLSNSLYLASAPAYWNVSATWPVVGPTAITASQTATNLPAGWRFANYGALPPSGGGGTITIQFGNGTATSLIQVGP